MDVTIRLTDEETAQLKAMAQRDRRTPAAQAAFIVASHVAVWADHDAYAQRRKREDEMLDRGSAAEVSKIVYHDTPEKALRAQIADISASLQEQDPQKPLRTYIENRDPFSKVPEFTAPQQDAPPVPPPGRPYSLRDSQE